MGKVIGGGLPVGAYGGRADIMAMVAPAGPMYQAGTLSGNPLAMTAGIKTLELLKRPGTYERLEAITARLSNGIQEAALAAGVPITGSHISAMFGFFFCPGPVRNFEEAKATDSRRWQEKLTPLLASFIPLNIHYISSLRLNPCPAPLQPPGESPLAAAPPPAAAAIPARLAPAGRPG
jgi:glutamate-1-semialdehyde aminotransferase